MEFLIGSILAIGFLLMFSWHVRVGMTRYFDVDEFSYIHWVTQFVGGKRPYVDFFMMFPPLYLFFFAPVVWVAGASADFFLTARMVAIGIEAVMFLTVGLLFGIIRDRRYLLLPSLLIAFLPMPFDKYFELRPDNLSTLFALLGVLFHVLFLRNTWPKQTSFLSGLCYASSLLIFPKALSFVVVAGVIWMFGAIPKLFRGTLFRDPLMHFLTGGAIISCIVGIYLVMLGHFDVVWYCLTKLAVETNTIVPFIMESHLFFFPGAAWYGSDGFSPGFLLNHFLWVSAILFGVFRLFTPVVTADGKKGGVLSELLVAGVFLFNAILYVAYYPNKHTQYLIPIGIFVGLYAADFIVFILNKLERVNRIIPIVILVIFIGILWNVAGLVNTKKLGWGNGLQLHQLRLMQQFIPKDAYVFDLEGRMIFWDQPYYICCLAIGDWIHLISRQPEPIHSMLEEKRVPWIFQGDSRRLYTLPWPDRAYIQEHYIPVEGWGENLWKRK